MHTKKAAIYLLHAKGSNHVHAHHIQKRKGKEVGLFDSK
jgi:hypothetical protein